MGLEALLTDFVPFRVGFDHMTREQVAQRNLIVPEHLFGNPDSPIEERKAISILDGTYIYLQKSTNYIFQRKSYSNHLMTQFNDFPRMTEEELTLFVLGSYQLKQSRSYYAAFIIELARNIPLEEIREIAERDLFLIRGRIQSRHVASRTYHVYIAADPTLRGRLAIPQYYCSCPIGKRTTGCCSHTMTIVWYMGFARYENIHTCTTTRPGR